jgi:hypothetical protein
MAGRFYHTPGAGHGPQFHGKRQHGGEIPIFTVAVNGPYRTVAGNREFEITFTCPHCRTGRVKKNGQRMGKAAVHIHGAPLGWDGSPLHKVAHCWDGPLGEYYLIAA